VQAAKKQIGIAAKMAAVPRTTTHHGTDHIAEIELVCVSGTNVGSSPQFCKALRKVGCLRSTVWRQQPSIAASYEPERPNRHRLHELTPESFSPGFFQNSKKSWLLRLTSRLELGKRTWALCMWRVTHPTKNHEINNQ
jgi:hypothetical protein